MLGFVDEIVLLRVVLDPAEIVRTKARVEKLGRLDLIGQAVTEAVTEIGVIIRHAGSAI